MRKLYLASVWNDC